MQGLLKLFPFLKWFPMSGPQIRRDLLTGLTVALVLIPQSMAYAQLAGMPAYYGLYAAFIPVILGALWGASFHLAGGPSALTALLITSTLILYAPPGSPEYVQLAILLALLVGIIRLIVGFLRLTFIVNFLSQPVIRGFTNAASLIIASSQISKIFGLSMGRSDFYLRDIWQIILNLGNLHLPTLCIGLLSIGIIFLLKRYAPKVPYALITAIAATLIVYYLKLYAPAESGRAVEIVGKIPSGLPKFQLPAFGIIPLKDLIPGALLVMFIGFMEVCSVTKAISIKSRQRIDLNQEIIGQGISAVAGSFFQCYPTSCSFSRSALSYSTGGKTGLSHVFTGGFVVLTLLFLTRYLYYLPQAALAAIIIMAVIGLVDFREMSEAWKVSAFDGVASAVTFGATLFFAPNLVKGILIGAGIALAFHLYRTMKPRAVILGPHDDGTMRDANLHGLDTEDELPVMRFDGRLYFANAPYFEEMILKIRADFPNARYLIIHGSGINGIDATGEALLRDLAIRCKDVNTPLVFTGLKHQIENVMKRTGLDEIIGKENFFRTVKSALGELKNRC